MIFIGLLLFPLVADASLSEYIKTSSFNESGFHYEYQSKLGFVVNSWSFVLNVDHNVLKSRLDQLFQVCEKLHADLAAGGKLQSCSGAGYERELEYLKNHKIADLDETHENIQYLLLRKGISRRHKRSIFGGAFNFVGRIYKSTIGIMDDDDAALLYEVAQHQNSTDYRVKLLTNQTLRITEYLNGVKHNIENAVDCLVLEKQLVYIKDNLEEIENTYNKIMTALQLALYGGRLSSLIISPKVVLDEMTAVDTKLLDKETEWITEPTIENMHTILHVIHCSVFINPDNQLMFVLQVPRVDKTKFELYKVVPIPSCNQHRICKFLTPHSQYIGFERKNTFYVRLDDTSTCTALDDITLCFGSMTSKYITYSNDCDVKMFYGTDMGARCEVHASKFNNEIFYSLNNVNRWFYMVDRPMLLQLNCGTGNFNHKLRINGTGVITLLQYCKIKTSRSVLVSKHVPAPDDYSKYKVVKFNFSDFYLPTSYTSEKVVKSLDYDTLSDITHNLKRLVTNEQAEKGIEIPNPSDNSNADWYLNLFGNWWWELKFIGYAFCIIVIVMVVLYLRRNCCCNFNSGSSKIVLPILSPKY